MAKNFRPVFLAAGLVLLLLRPASADPVSGIFTYHFNNARDGQNTNETILTHANVNSASFGKVFSRNVDGYVYAEPLYVNAVQIPGVGSREVVYVGTEHDSVYAFDATGATKKPLWQVSFLNKKAKVTTVPAKDTGTDDLSPEIGITGTPVIDPSSNTLFVVAKTREGPNKTRRYFLRLHALDLATGAEKFGGPIAITATAQGTIDNSTPVTITFDPLLANQRSGLALSNGVVYVAFASHGDVGEYHGWMLGYDASTLEQVSSFIVSPNTDSSDPNPSWGGIWMSGGAPMIDADGSLFVVTANGTFDANVGGADYGDSLLKLGPTGSTNLDVLDSFTPFDQAALEAGDTDFGSGGVIALPDQAVGPQHLAVTGGKIGILYLLNRDSLGGFSATEDLEAQAVVQSIDGQLNHIFSTPAYFNGNVYVGDTGESLKAFSLSNGQLSTTPSQESSMSFGFPGTTPVVSANGDQDGIVWAIERGTKVAVLHGLDATDLSHELYNSSQAKRNRDRMTGYVKFTVPTVANGRVFVGTVKRLTVFGLLPQK